MSRDELDDLLRLHLRDKLSGQRGRALRAFEERVTRPMQMRLSRPTRSTRQRQWATTALAMAACMAVGFVLPRFLASPGSDAEWPGASTFNPSLADYDGPAPRRNGPINPFTVDGPSPDHTQWQSPIHTAPFTGRRTDPQSVIIEPSEPSADWQTR
jgi:hypothetical protein